MVGWSGDIIAMTVPGALEKPQDVDLTVITPDYLRTARTPLLAGRDFAASDAGTSVPVGIVNEANTGNWIIDIRAPWLAPLHVSEAPWRVDFGETTMEPEIVMTMEADTAHKFWLGKVNVTVALARGQMKAKGPVAKILKLVPLVKPVFPRYRAMLEEADRKDLLEAA